MDCKFNNLSHLEAWKIEKTKFKKKQNKLKQVNKKQECVETRKGHGSTNTVHAYKYMYLSVHYTWSLSNHKMWQLISMLDCAQEHCILTITK